MISSKYTIKHLHAANLSVHLPIHATPSTTIARPPSSKHDKASKLSWVTHKACLSTTTTSIRLGGGSGLQNKTKTPFHTFGREWHGTAEKDCVLIMMDKLNANFLEPFNRHTRRMMELGLNAMVLSLNFNFYFSVHNARQSLKGRNPCRLLKDFLCLSFFCVFPWSSGSPLQDTFYYIVSLSLSAVIRREFRCHLVSIGENGSMATSSSPPAALHCSL